ncbi:alpha/beta-hydrolase [Mollisia scopiformis]|uniref:Alpha/beta-hydrolase n=1 Tax=Mollisia scopiformis TaxID=149040 RepID=A0A194XI53_MOLSC|nr:alpha/beta-hydrolase [Mollisia scopiformis]KUJ19816.1 alpha/beta-hydrolase [Mollisia scopiformis]
MSVDARVYYHTTANGSHIFIEECGNGPLMVLMHGLGGTTNAFQPLVNHFASRFTMLRFDLPGSGFSTFKTPPSIPRFVEDLKSILKSRGTDEEPILIGHSLGSILAMHYATQYPVKGLILIGAGRSAVHIPAAVAHMTGLAVKAREGIPGIRDSTVANNVAPSSSDLVRTVVRQMISSQDPLGYAATCEALCAKSHVDPDYSKIKCPTMLIAGDQDKISPLSRSEDLQKLIGGEDNKVALKVVHSGHQHVLENTEGVVEAIESLAGSLSR